MVKKERSVVSEARLKELLATKDYSESLMVIERLLTVKPSDERYLLMLGRLYELIEQATDFKDIYEKVVNTVPGAYNTHLMLGRYYHSKNDFEKTFKHYVTALRAANNGGFWLDRESTAPWVHRYVVQALNFCDKHRRDIVGSWITELQQTYGLDEMERVAKGIRIYSGELPAVYDDPRQKPGFLYIPGLPVKPVFERKDLDFIDYYESQFDKIKAELDNLILQNVPIENYRDTDKHGLTKGGDWDAKFFFRHGKRYDDTHTLCPQTSEILTHLPLVHIQDHSPEVCFSVLRPGAHLLPHRGVTNSRSVLHMGLQIPADCALNVVDIEELHWQPGKVFAFDDNYLHEAWNRSDQSRYVLLADIWNPFLTDAECCAITDFVTKVSSLDGK
ncbi:Aspartyl/Asparaginyl beta-hydroxylase [Rheinheimera pacifica]|uniref:Aspartyl/Asparaginyl beta-hydroxylase n=1 Tax=Rheinheimera pacifica TaxID=173990 RepID=A0A1H6N598_9GAMM|nr:aspartyl/asparaginyl beta-hydroxylase domain-containing protein [Rheinheimera pacifica]SEI09852.1 Aspartyl/Asparaginyl beta-hydroxylase [Rheinheimera pacifica]